MTVRATTARMGAPAWMVSTPTTASARPSGQVMPPPAARVAQGWAERMDPAPGDAGDRVGRAVLLCSDAHRACGSWAAPASCRCPVPWQVSTAPRTWTNAS